MCSSSTCGRRHRRPHCQRCARLHCTTMKHTAGGQRLGRLACFATQKKSRNRILLAYAISRILRCRDRRCGPFPKHLPRRAPVILLPAFIRPPSIESETAAEFWRAIGGRRRVCGFDGHMDGMLISAEDAAFPGTLLFGFLFCHCIEDYRQCRVLSLGNSLTPLFCRVDALQTAACQNGDNASIHNGERCDR